MFRYFVIFFRFRLWFAVQGKMRWAGISNDMIYDIWYMIWYGMGWYLEWYDMWYMIWYGMGWYLECLSGKCSHVAIVNSDRNSTSVFILLGSLCTMAVSRGEHMVWDRKCTLSSGRHSLYITRETYEICVEKRHTHRRLGVLSTGFLMYTTYLLAYILPTIANCLHRCMRSDCAIGNKQQMFSSLMTTNRITQECHVTMLRHSKQDERMQWKPHRNGTRMEMSVDWKQISE